LSGDEGEEVGDDEGEGVHDAVTKRLKREELEESGKLKQSVAENFSKEAAPNLVEARSVLEIQRSKPKDVYLS
jgi:hypothetical protein